MRILIYLIAVPALTYAAMMGYLWLQVKSSADEVVKSAAGFADIQYDSVYTSLTGDEIGLDNIIIKPIMTNDEFRIEKIRLNAPHAGYFLQADSRLKSGNIPENLGVSVQRIHVDLNSDLFSMMEQGRKQALAQQQASPSTVLANIDTVGCGDKRALGLADYRKMGVGKVVADARFNIGYDKSSDRATIKSHIKTDNYYTVDFRAGFNTQSGRFNPGSAIAALPDMEVSYTDTGMYKLRNSYCASLSNSDIESYVTHHIQLAGEQLGVGLPDEFLLAYKDYMLNGGTITVGISPVSDIPTDSLQYYPPDEVVKMLGLQIAINGNSLDNKQIRWLGAATRPRPEKTKPGNNTDTKKSTTTRPKVPSAPLYSYNRPAPKYHKVDVSNARKHINRFVEVTLFNGRVRKGILDKVNEGRLYLVLELQGGNLSFPVKMSDVESFRVRY